MRKGVASFASTIHELNHRTQMNSTIGIACFTQELSPSYNLMLNGRLILATQITVLQVHCATPPLRLIVVRPEALQSPVQLPGYQYNGFRFS